MAALDHTINRPIRSARVTKNYPVYPGTLMIAPAHIKARILGDLVPRLVDLGLASEHQPRHQQRLRPRTALGQPALDQQLIDAALWRLGGTANCGRWLVGHGQERLLACKVGG